MIFDESVSQKRERALVARVEEVWGWPRCSTS